MRKTKLSKSEQEIENELLGGGYSDVPKQEFDEIAKAIAYRRKDAVLNIRINSQDLKAIKSKANRQGVKYQTFIAELLHRFAHQ
jgi:predicted DNA binding CopG/RHH family protein